MGGLEIYQFSCLSDNFGVLAHDTGSGLTASIDAPEAAAVLKALGEKNWTLSHILTTHHHHDHVGGHEELKDKTGCIIIGAAADSKRIPGIDIELEEGDNFTFGEEQFKIIDTPGHTIGHIAYFAENSHVAFVGDTLFSLGCGRLFEGSAAQMWASLQKLKDLPADTQIYCGHEYTKSNADFALSIEPGNEDLQKRAADIAQLRARGLPSLPVSLESELKCNPFLRPDSPEIQKNLHMTGHALEDVFAEIRHRKDVF